MNQISTNMKYGNIMFLLTLQPNPRFVKQINYLCSKYSVSVLHFNRDNIVDFSKQLESKIFQYNLGTISSGKYIKRLLVFLKNLPTIKNHIDNHKIKYIIFDKFDAFIIFYLIRFLYLQLPKDIIKIIEVSDLREVQFSQNIISKMFRFFERKLMNKYIEKLIVTSPKYFEEYYKNFYKGDVFVLENKPLKVNLPTIKNIDIKNDIELLKVGIIGGLYRGKPTKTLLKLGEKNKWINIKVYGLGRDEKIIKEYARHCDNISFFGAYNFFSDAMQIYSSIDVAYIVYDTTRIDKNTKYALPNKLYECMYFRIPMVVSKGTYLAERVENEKIGIAVDFINENEILSAFRKIKKEYSIFTDNFAKLSPDKFLGDSDYKKLLKFIND